MSSTPSFQPPSSAERLFNRMFGFVVSLGLGPAYMYQLEVRGRKTGRIFSTPVSLVELDGKRFLVAPRGRTQWVRNAEAAGEVNLKKGSNRRNYRLRVLPDTEKPEILRTYLEHFRSAVQRFFPIPAGSPAQDFAPLAGNYPVFELSPQ